MTADSRDDSLVISDWDGNLYRIPRELLQQFRIPNDEPAVEFPVEDTGQTGSTIHRWRARLRHEPGRRLPPGPPSQHRHPEN